LEGQATVYELLTGISQISSLDVNNLKALTCDFDNVTADSLTLKQLTVSGNGYSISVGGEAVAWQTYTARYCTLVAGAHYFMYTNTSGGTNPTGTAYGQIVSGVTNTTLHYLGKAST
jgi:hypothetical protein